MKKLIALIGATSLVVTPALITISCSQNDTFEARLRKIIGFRKIKPGYKYLDNWKNLMLKNSIGLNQMVNNSLWELSNFSGKWFNETQKNIKTGFKPFPQKELKEEKFSKKIYLDFEFPYASSPTTPFSGASLVTSTLGEDSFFQIYNYKYLKDRGYEFKVSVVKSEENKNKNIINIVNDIPDNNGAVFLTGTEVEGNENLLITAIKKDKLGMEKDKLETRINVTNVFNQSNSFIQWKTYQWIKYDYSQQETFQLIIAQYLVQIYSQMMYNYSYNLKPDLTLKIPLLDENMLDMLYCAANYGQYVNYLEYWPAGNLPISGFGLFYSYDFYVHASYQEPYLELVEQVSNPVVRLNHQLVSYANEILNQYEDLKGEMF